ncbi:MAG: methylmalonyl Co-A mutase-associated GTPase MeaB, partial [Polynucleobacter sp.]|nr:methylmalonyl Co-A mutase-associated GTPase MeaB [Polynucleobacter sp.]
IEAGLKTSFREHEAVQALLPEMVRAVNQGTMAASVAARRLLELLAK